MSFLNYRLFTLFIYLLLPSTILAQDITLTATVSRNEVDLNGQFQYSVEVSGKSTNLPNVNFPEFKNFRVLSGPNTSTSIQWINGAMTSSKTYSFYLQPKKEGKFTIAKASISTKDQTYSSEEIQITVKKGAAQSQTQRRSSQSRSDPDISGENLYIKAKVSRSNAYLGQQIIVNYKLYFKINIRGYNIDKLPANAGFWSEEFKMPSQPVVENEVINGVNYNVASLKKIALFPTQVGKLTIEPMQVTLEAMVKSRRQRSLFDSFFDDPFGRTVQKTITSKPLNINVKSLPDQGKPSDFKGAVGNYNFSVSVDKTETQVNDAISLKLRMNGVGNIKLIDLPKPNIPTDIEQYEPKISSNIKNQGNSISGSKTAEYILIPRLEGQYQIKPIRFSYFNPTTKKYNTVSSGPIDLNIEKGTGSAITLSQKSPGFSRQEVTLLGQDIRFIKEFSTFYMIGAKPYLTSQFWGSILAAIVLFIGFITYNNYQVRLTSNEHLARSRKAGKHASRQLMAARKLIDSDNSNEFFKAITQALQGFVRDKLNIDLTDFSVRNVRIALAKRQIDQKEIDEYIAVLEESDFKQFANISASSDERNDFLSKAKDILTRLEKWI